MISDWALFVLVSIFCPTNNRGLTTKASSTTIFHFDTPSSHKASSGATFYRCCLSAVYPSQLRKAGVQTQELSSTVFPKAKHFLSLCVFFSAARCGMPLLSLYFDVAGLLSLVKIELCDKKYVTLQVGHSCPAPAWCCSAQEQTLT